MSTIQIRVDTQSKKKVKKVLDELGLDFTTAIKIYFHQIVSTQSIPFKLLTKNGFTPAHEKKLVAESRETLRLYKAGKLKGYPNAKSMWADILKD